MLRAASTWGSLLAGLTGVLCCACTSVPYDGGLGGGGASPATTTTTTSTAGGGNVNVDEVAVMTWNLESFPLYPDTPERVRAVIDSLSPDVIAVQEIGDEASFHGLVSSLDGYAGLLADDAENFIRVGLIYRTGRVSVGEVTTLFQGDWYPFPRPVLSAELQIDGFDFVALVVHLKAYGDEESVDRRRVAIERLDEHLRAAMDGASEQDFVVLGDFNDELTDTPTTNVFGPLLDATDRYRFLTLPLEQSGTHTYLPYNSMIDHVLVTTDVLPELGDDGLTQVVPLDSSVEDYYRISDHIPVMVRFRGI